MSKDGFASLNLFFNSKFDVGRSMFDVHLLLLRSNWTHVASAAADL